MPAMPTTSWTYYARAADAALIRSHSHALFSPEDGGIARGMNARNSRPLIRTTAGDVNPMTDRDAPTASKVTSDTVKRSRPILVRGSPHLGSRTAEVCDISYSCTVPGRGRSRQLRSTSGGCQRISPHYSLDSQHQSRSLRQDRRPMRTPRVRRRAPRPHSSTQLLDAECLSGCMSMPPLPVNSSSAGAFIRRQRESVLSRGVGSWDDHVARRRNCVMRTRHYSVCALIGEKHDAGVDSSSAASRNRDNSDLTLGSGDRNSVALTQSF